MPEPHTLLLFTLAALLFSASPGPNFVFVLTRSLSRGRSDGVMSVLGIGVGALLHTFAAVLGVSALVSTSALAFTVMKTFGALYLIYLGLKTLLSREEVVSALPLPTDKSAAFREGFVTMMLNPKVALYFLAFLPQFVDPSKQAAGQLLVLGSAQVVAEVSVLLVLACVAGMLSGTLRANPVFQKSQKYFTGGVYLLLGLFLALSGRKAS